MAESNQSNASEISANIGCITVIVAPFGLQYFWNSHLMSNGDNHISYWTALVGFLIFSILK